MTRTMLFSFILLVAAPFLAADQDLRIHLLREVVATEDPLTVGAVAVVSAADDMAEAVRAVPVGRSPWPGEELVLTRPVLLARLATSGFDVHAATLTGAEQVRIVSVQKSIPAKRIIDLARDKLLEKTSARMPDARWAVVGRVLPATVDLGEGPLEIAAAVVAGSTREDVVVEVVGASGDAERFRRNVTFRLLRTIPRIVASRDIPPGALIDWTNVRIEEAEATSAGRGDPGPDELIGSYALRRIRAGDVLRSHMVSERSPEILVKRDELVRMVIRLPGVLVTAVGKAVSPGRAGDVIKVRNVDSSRVITAIVTAAGVVEPIFAH